MPLESVEKHIQKIERRRSGLFIQSLRFSIGYQNSFGGYYPMMVFLSVVIIMADITLFFTFEFNSFIKISLLFATFSFLLSMISYLSFLEKGSRNVGDIFKKLDLRYKQEAGILRNFYGGKIIEKDVRDFYLNNKLTIDNRYFSNKQWITWCWINFIFLALAMITMLLNFLG